MIKVLGRTALLAGIVALTALAGAGAPAQAKADHCDKAWDCHGPLPFYCTRCSNGQFECTHWTCVHHACAVETCPKK